MIQITPRFCPPYPLTFLLFSSVQTKQYKIKTWKVHMHTTNKQTWSLLILSNSFWAYGQHWSVIDILSVLYHWKKKLISFSLSSCQLQITSWLEVGIGITSSSFFLFCDFCLGWTCTSLVHAVIVCEFTCESTLLYLENAAASVMPRGYSLSMSSLQRALSLEFNKDISFSIKNFTVSHYLHSM